MIIDSEAVFISQLYGFCTFEDILGKLEDECV